MSPTTQLIAPEEVAAYLGISPDTINTFRKQGRGPRYTRVGKLVRYRLEDVEEWLARHTVDPEVGE